MPSCNPHDSIVTFAGIPPQKAFDHLSLVMALAVLYDRWVKRRRAPINDPFCILFRFGGTLTVGGARRPSSGVRLYTGCFRGDNRLCAFCGSEYLRCAAIIHGVGVGMQKHQFFFRRSLVARMIRLALEYVASGLFKIWGWEVRLWG